ncbi:MAG: DUF5700 domain-containing putative Zn-dependent protease [Candidatus Natronoplasma sp.]
MKMEPGTGGTELLLDVLEKVGEDHKIEEEDIGRVMEHEDIAIWLDAYRGIDDVSKKFERALLSVDEGPRSDLGFWEKKIDYGLRKAYDNIEQMRESMLEIKKIDWRSVVEKALEYLPENTELEPDLIVTVDGFNGGMFLGDTVFLSVVYFDKTRFREDAFAHEFHHIGAEYWLEKNEFIKEYEQKGGSSYLTRLFKYLVGEGLANAFCSPGAITRSGGDDEYDQMIKNYEEERDELFARLEGLTEKIVEMSDEGISEAYEGFTMDKEGAGLPQGHFLSGRMVMAMKESRGVEDEEIIDLVKHPFDFFKLYNRAAEERNERRFSPELVDEIDELVKNDRR